MCILAFIFLFTSIFITNIRLATTEDGFERFFDKIELSDINVNVAEDSTYVSLAEWLHEELYKEYPDWAEASKSDIAELLDEGTFKEFIVDKMADLCEDLYEGNISTEIEESEIEDLLLENEWILEEEDLYIPESYAEDMASQIVEYEFIEALNDGDLEDELSDYAMWDITRILVSVPMICVYALIGILLFVLAFRINKGFYMSAVLHVSCTTLVLGALYLLLWLVSLCIPFLLDSVSGLPYYIVLVINHIFGSGIYIYLAVTVISVLAIVIRKLLKDKRIKFFGINKA